jgi:hypothetical protein
MGGDTMTEVCVNIALIHLRAATYFVEQDDSMMCMTLSSADYKYAQNW